MSAYWLFAELARLVDYRYRACAEIVRNTCRSFKEETFRALAEVEASLVEASTGGEPDETVLADLLTKFDEKRAAEAIDRLRGLLVGVKTRASYEE